MVLWRSRSEEVTTNLKLPIPMPLLPMSRDEEAREYSSSSPSVRRNHNHEKNRWNRGNLVAGGSLSLAKSRWANEEDRVFGLRFLRSGFD
ncbi:hypothetical protein TIFTF001_031705 [Ficus carica]|uniref:Uncharacterized protein n=1 Tax=Ficus carica TaxID=3494 RepID=A0AA88DVI1_FICCA|nr:hypothetical protein TIFTF001_031705 [Ficus carica]